MSHIEKRGPGRYRARYIAPDGKERSKTFARKVDGERFLSTVEADKLRGTWVDPAAGKLTFREYAERWRTSQVQHSPGTAELVEGHLRRHVLPTFGDRQLRSILRSDVQAWVTERSEVLAPATVRLIYSYVATILRAAVHDGLIATSPCRQIKLPKVEKKRVVPLPTERVTAIIAATPLRWRAAVILAASTGMRQGEVLGLNADQIDFLRRQVRVDRQMWTPTKGAPRLAPLKTEASARTIPLPDVALEALAEHIRTQKLGEDGLLFPTLEGSGMRRQRFIDTVWKPAVEKAKATGADFHELRHYYASLLIHAGESVKVVQARLGHKSATETLDTYGHLWEDSEDRTRTAVDAVLGASATASPRPEESVAVGNVALTSTNGLSAEEPACRPGSVPGHALRHDRRRSSI